MKKVISILLTLLMVLAVFPVYKTEAAEAPGIDCMVLIDGGMMFSSGYGAALDSAEKVVDTLLVNPNNQMNIFIMQSSHISSDNTPDFFSNDAAALKGWIKEMRSITKYYSAEPLKDSSGNVFTTFSNYAHYMTLAYENLENQLLYGETTNARPDAKKVLYIIGSGYCEGGTSPTNVDKTNWSKAKGYFNKLPDKLGPNYSYDAGYPYVDYFGVNCAAQIGEWLHDAGYTIYCIQNDANIDDYNYVLDKELAAHKEVRRDRGAALLNYLANGGMLDPGQSFPMPEGGGSEETPPPDPTTPSVPEKEKKLEIIPTYADFIIDETFTLKAELDGQPVSPMWMSDDPSAISIDQNGVIKVLKAGGEVNIMAVYESYSAVGTYTLRGDLVIRPDINIKLDLNGTYTRQFEAEYGASYIHPEKVTWSVSPAGLATIREGGFLIAEKVGNVTVTAVDEFGNKAEKSIEIVDTTVKTGEQPNEKSVKEPEEEKDEQYLVIETANNVLEVDRTGYYFAVLMPSGETVPADFSSSNSSVLDVSIVGSGRGIKPGTARVTAVYNGLTADTSVSVIAEEVDDGNYIGTPTYLEIRPDKTDLEVGDVVEYSAYLKGTKVDADFSVTNASIATITQDGKLTALNKGNTTVKAFFARQTGNLKEDWSGKLDIAVSEDSNHSADTGSGGWKQDSSGWRQDGNGWWYQNANGSYPANTWFRESGVWYHFDAAGYMQTGWLNDAGSWYYLGSSGAMLVNTTTPDGYFVDWSGKLDMTVSEDDNHSADTGNGGWKQDGNGWWYQKANGSYPANDWLRESGAWYHFNAAGYMQTGWFNDAGTWYYLSPSGEMLVNTTTPDGYFVDENGVWIP